MIKNRPKRHRKTFQNRAQDGAKRASKLAVPSLLVGLGGQDAPRPPKDLPKTAPRRPKTAQDLPQTRQDAPKTRPRPAKDLTKTPQDPTRPPKDGPRPPRRRPRPPKSSPREPRRRQKAPKREIFREQGGLSKQSPPSRRAKPSGPPVRSPWPGLAVWKGLQDLT